MRPWYRPSAPDRRRSTLIEDSGPPLVILVLNNAGLRKSVPVAEFPRLRPRRFPGLETTGIEGSCCVPEFRTNLISSVGGHQAERFCNARSGAGVGSPRHRLDNLEPAYPTGVRRSLCAPQGGFTPVQQGDARSYRSRLQKGLGPETRWSTRQRRRKAEYPGRPRPRSSGCL
jgi:hypothetical protein